MEKRSSNTLSPSTLSLPYFILFLLLDVFLKWVIRLKKFYSSSECFLQSQLDIFHYGSSKKVTGSELYKPELDQNEKVEEYETLSRVQVHMVMEILRFVVCEENDEMPQDRLGSKELFNMFEVKEPSVEEVKEAFDIFDENKDGFVDAAELQRVLCILGFAQGAKVEECEKMIKVFDENRDGLIDSNEFARLLETSFC